MLQSRGATDQYQPCRYRTVRRSHPNAMFDAYRAPPAFPRGRRLAARRGGARANMSPLSPASIQAAASAGSEWHPPSTASIAHRCTAIPPTGRTPGWHPQSMNELFTMKD